MVIDSNKIAIIKKINEVIEKAEAIYCFKVANIEIRFGETVEHIDEETGESYTEEHTNEVVLYLDKKNLAIIDSLGDKSFTNLMELLDSADDSFMYSFIDLPNQKEELTYDAVKKFLESWFGALYILSIDINVTGEEPVVTVELITKSFIKIFRYYEESYYDSAVEAFASKYGACLCFLMGKKVK